MKNEKKKFRKCIWKKKVFSQLKKVIEFIFIFYLNELTNINIFEKNVIVSNKVLVYSFFQIYN